MENPIPHNPYFDKFSFRTRVSDKVMLEETFPKSGLSLQKLNEFKKMLDIAKECGMKVIVAFITGWMSGRRFVPEALRGKDVIVDPTAILWECRFIKDMISELKHYDNIIAWEPGNECNCLSYEANDSQSELWLMSIVNAIRLADNTRPVYSGMHSVRLQGSFNARIVARHTDMMTTHPYPSFTPYCETEDVRQMRASLHAACENSYYSSLSQKPCMVEEINVLGPCSLSDKFVPEYFERSLMTSLASGTTGYLWWCAFEQDKLDFPPYDCNQLERNLGLAYSDYTAKPVLEKFKETAKIVKEIGVLPAPKADAVCILTFLMDHWKVAYGAYMLGVQTGRQIDFAYEEDEIRDSDYYILPCVQVTNSIPYLQLKKIIERVEKGANLLITYNGGGFGDFECLTGLQVAGKEAVSTNKTFTINGKEMTISCPVRLKLETNTAEVLIRDNKGEVLLSQNKLGKGKVVFFNAPLETFYTEAYLPENTPLFEVYKQFFKDKKKVFGIENEKVMTTVHELGDNEFAVMINNYDEYTQLAFEIADGYEITEAKYAEIKDGVLCMQKPYAYLELKRI
jgi:hypothetical protein